MRLLVALTVGALVGTEREKRWAKEERAGDWGNLVYWACIFLLCVFGIGRFIRWLLV